MATLQGVRRVLRESLVNDVAGSSIWPQRVRVGIYRSFGMRAAEAGVLAGCRFIAGVNVSLGAGTFINAGCVFDAEGAISMGTNVAVGPGCIFLTSTHELSDDPHARAGVVRIEPITVGNGVWIGAGVKVLPGITIGEGSVIAAGAVVTQDVAPNTMSGGVPARKLQDLQIAEIR
jgi:maltose O-acetyltransferase